MIRTVGTARTDARKIHKNRQVLRVNCHIDHFCSNWDVLNNNCPYFLHRVNDVIDLRTTARLKITNSLYQFVVGGFRSGKKLCYVFHYNQWKRLLELKQISIAKMEEEVVPFVSDAIPSLNVRMSATVRRLNWSGRT
jgi:hypothetical protein